MSTEEHYSMLTGNRAAHVVVVCAQQPAGAIEQLLLRARRRQYGSPLDLWVKAGVHAHRPHLLAAAEAVSGRPANGGW